MAQIIPSPFAMQLAKAIFESGNGPAQTTRIQFMSGDYPDNEKPEGGLCLHALAQVIEQFLTGPVDPVRGTTPGDDVDDQPLCSVDICPCLLADEPCGPYCSCRKSISSYGCRSCARYGSDEQRKTAANRIVALTTQSDTIATLTAERDRLRLTPGRVLDVCKQRGWSLHWTARGAYLHLESSELIEAIRGKHGDPIEESGDVLIVLTSITENAGITWESVIDAANRKLTDLETKPRYKGEEFTAAVNESK